MFVYYSWGSYFLVTGLILSGYFIAIGFIYYKKEILAIVGKKDPIREAMEAPVKRTDALPMVHELVSELGIIIRDAALKETVIPELLVAMKEKIKDFSVLEPTEYKSKINLYILQELEIHGIKDISRQQIEQLWKFT